MSKQTLDDLGDLLFFELYTWHNYEFDRKQYQALKKKLEPYIESLIRQEQLSLLKRLLEESEVIEWPGGSTSKVVDVSAIELEMKKLLQPTEGEDRE